MTESDLELGKLQGLEVGLEPRLGLLLSEQRLAQVVDVHPHAGLAARLEVLRQKLPFRGQDHVGRLLAHLVLDERNGHARQVAPEGLEALEERPLHGAEEPGHSLHVEDVCQLVGGARGARGAKGLIRELGERRLVVRVLDHPLELRLLLLLLGRLQIGCALLEHAGEVRTLLRRCGGRSLRIGLEAGEDLVERALERRVAFGHDPLPRRPRGLAPRPAPLELSRNTACSCSWQAPERAPCTRRSSGRCRRR